MTPLPAGGAGPEQAERAVGAHVGGPDVPQRGGRGGVSEADFGIARPGAEGAGGALVGEGGDLGDAVLNGGHPAEGVRRVVEERRPGPRFCHRAGQAAGRVLNQRVNHDGAGARLDDQVFDQGVADHRRRNGPVDGNGLAGGVVDDAVDLPEVFPINVIGPSNVRPPVLAAVNTNPLPQFIALEIAHRAVRLVPRGGVERVLRTPCRCPTANWFPVHRCSWARRASCCPHSCWPRAGGWCRWTRTAVRARSG